MNRSLSLIAVLKAAFVTGPTFPAHGVGSKRRQPKQPRELDALGKLRIQRAIDKRSRKMARQLAERQRVTS